MRSPFGITYSFSMDLKFIRLDGCMSFNFGSDIFLFFLSSISANSNDLFKTLIQSMSYSTFKLPSYMANSTSVLLLDFMSIFNTFTSSAISYFSSSKDSYSLLVSILSGFIFAIASILYRICLNSLCVSISIACIPLPTLSGTPHVRPRLGIILLQALICSDTKNDPM